MGNGFFQTTLLGLIGTVTGIGALGITYFNFRYNKPRVIIKDLSLEIPDDIKHLAGKTLDELKNCVLNYELEILVSNSRGGAGSIGKPILAIEAKKDPKHKIELNPVTQHQEWERENSNTINISTVRHGRSFNLGPGESADEKLEYISYDPEIISFVANNFDELNYSVDYFDNSGKRHNKKIDKIIKETD